MKPDIHFFVNRESNTVVSVMTFDLYFIVKWIDHFCVNSCVTLHFLCIIWPTVIKPSIHFYLTGTWTLWYQFTIMFTFGCHSFYTPGIRSMPAFVCPQGYIVFVCSVRQSVNPFFLLQSFLITYKSAATDQKLFIFSMGLPGRVLFNSTSMDPWVMPQGGARGQNLGHPNAGLGGSVGYAVRLETRRSRVQPPPRSVTFSRGDWSWNIFYGHSLPSADSRRAVVSFWRKNVHNTG